MKKMAMSLILICLFSICKAPVHPVLNIAAGTVIAPYEALIKAIVMVESANGKYQYNAKENAVGYFQIRQVRVNDYNKKLGTNYKLTDFYDYDLSRSMFLYYAQGKSYEVAAKDWNGSGEMTIDYWRKVQKYLL